MPASTWQDRDGRGSPRPPGAAPPVCGGPPAAPWRANPTEACVGPGMCGRRTFPPARGLPRHRGLSQQRRPRPAAAAAGHSKAPPPPTPLPGPEGGSSPFPAAAHRPPQSRGLPHPEDPLATRPSHTARIPRPEASSTYCHPLAPPQPDGRPTGPSASSELTCPRARLPARRLCDSAALRWRAAG